jgi:predicted methyltransferase
MGRINRIENSTLYFLDPSQREKINTVRELPAGLSLSLDAGFSETMVELNFSGILLPDGMELPLPEKEMLHSDEVRTILIFKDNRWQKWQHFDEQTGKFYKMVFTQPGRPPTVEISGIKMHVTKDSDPSVDTANKLKALGSVKGSVLDTCCGMGYTAIALAKLGSVQEVITVERDPNMVQLCRENPWSRGLFESDKINLLSGNAAEKITGFADRSFAAILHDPPRFALAPELYEESFYRHCCRILQNGGKMYHYTGDPNKAHRSSLPEKTIERLKKAGFRRAKKSYQGVLALK